ncbi:MAG: TonB-dependent receptor plug domain-containing protein, partial [Candidatus Baltobacteraceae bacterium]
MSKGFFARRSCGAIALWLTLSAAAAAAEPTLAPTPAPTPAPASLPEIGRVVTSDRQDEPLRAATRTTYVVPKSEIVARGYLTVAEALATLPGVVVLRNGALGALSGVSIRGAAPSQTLILLDGLPLGGAQTGTLDLGEISTSGVERVEVVEGGGSTLYGAGAIGGIVNILTSRAPRAVQAKVIDGSFGTREVAIETQHVSFERLVARNDFPTVAGAVPGGPRINSDVESMTARVRGERHLGRLELQGSAGISDVHLGAPGPLYLPYVPSSSSGPTPNPSSPNSYASSTSRQDTTSSDARASLTLRKAHATTTLDLSGTRQVLQYASAPSDLNGCF